MIKCEQEFYIAGRLLNWLTSYLGERRQRVVIGNVLSTFQATNAGVPQGSVLGPLLALMYLNGLTDNISNGILLYADDTTIYAAHTDQSISSVQASLQQDIRVIEAYAKQWAITFNSTKTLQQTFSNKKTHEHPRLTLSGQDIPLVETHRHLGISFSKDVRFQTHVKSAMKKVNMALSPLYSAAHTIPRNILN